MLGFYGWFREKPAIFNKILTALLVKFIAQDEKKMI